ncbi:hypothetical protein NCU12131 [Neurospora crassa OR74A]|uniref:Uncharacterized protein n=1 Tax=Neurospora crassa (strain ATCC 24698 / 74-OR23-1A / CBS 708.71 / DSM 1257 / FGSC 987) TaxID=367110 RepID=V5IKU6_NEUCR|nr:hypothetical protein NCU12131 [Neurospora crassa OR74A]ESA42298.1 hypothetical protein NCU12131 [Neurospora crassa OR74A]|eukprot:XP_011395061.1 hypothetical protein NCU12131 [Neurospora crassa OR74A]
MGYERKPLKGKWEKQSERSQGTHVFVRNIAHQSYQHFKVLGARSFSKVFPRNVFSLHNFLCTLFISCSPALACQSLVLHTSLIDGIRLISTYIDCAFRLSVLPF